MRIWITLAILLSAALAGCAGEEGTTPTADAVQDSDDGTNETATAAETATSTGAPEDNGTDDTATNTPPTAELTADVVNGTAPLNVTFTIEGQDADGDDLSWALTVEPMLNGTGTGNVTELAEGESLPASVAHNFTSAGTYAVVLTVSDGDVEAASRLNVTAVTGIPTGLEVFYIHAEGSGDGTMDHTPASGSEGGHGTVAIAGTPPYAKSYTATEPTFAMHGEGTTVEAHVQAFGLLPSPQVTMTGTLLADGTVVGTGTSDAEDSISVALVTTPCTDWTITFELTQDVPPGATLEFQVEGDNVVRLAPCYPGGEDGPRVMLS